MTFEIAFKRSLFSPNFIQYGDDKPRPSDEAHLLGRGLQKISKGQDQNQGGGNESEPQKGGKYDSRGYRKLTSISLGEVKSAYKFYENQLMPTSYGSFIAVNHFYILDLAQQEKDIPAAVFGRVNVCHPGDGHIQNIRELELAFPQQSGKPDMVHLRPRDILTPPQGNVQSYCVRVKFLASQEDIEDFIGHENVFYDAGFAVEFEAGYLELLNMDESHRDSLPWFHVIGSRWFTSIPYSVQEEVRSRLKKLVEWGSLILNYHPDHTSFEVKTLNRELGFQHGYTDIALIEPRNPGQVLQIIKPTFEKIFVHPIK